jgi:peptidoglycan/LPS O-acetylase OafA/YrhL
MPLGQQSKSWVPELDGLRGFAALWVFSMHVALLSGASIPIVSQGAYGVDLFILLSGFVMAHQYEQRHSSGASPSAKEFLLFWVRRFFRIAPLYYVLLIVAFLLGPMLMESRSVIGAIYHASLADGSRYLDRTFLNFVSHLSFAFGIIPKYSYSTPLPDWSIGLEMQFYFAFPFLALIVRKAGYGVTAVITTTLTLLAFFCFRTFFTAFPMPSFLLLKLHLFILGMIIAGYYHDKERKPWIFIVLLPLIGALFVRKGSAYGTVPVDIILAAFFLFLVQAKPRPQKIFEALKGLLSSPRSRFIGEISYSIYLIHLLVVLPVNAAFLRSNGIVHFPGVARFMICFITSSLIVIPLAYVSHRFFEVPGIRLGKTAIGKLSGGTAKPLA